MIINQLSRYLISLKYDDIPEEAIQKVKLCFIDYLAVYLRGLESERASSMESHLIAWIWMMVIDTLNCIQDLLSFPQYWLWHQIRI